MWVRPRKHILIVAGILYAIFGLLAFFDIPGGHDEHHHTFAHNLTHIALGALLLGITWLSGSSIRQRLCFAFAAGYVVVGSLGAFIGQDVTLALIPGFIEFHAGDYAVHFATALFFFALGLLPRSDETVQTVSPA